MAQYIYGIITGATIGALAGGIKYFFLWHPLLKKQSEEDQRRRENAVLHRMGIGYVINIVTLLGIFFARDFLPFNFEATLISAAIALSIVSKLCPITKVFSDSKKAK